MKIKSADYIKGVVGTDPLFEDGIPQVAFIGRSNVGKSSVINSLVNRRDLARSSATAGKTREINFFLINKDFYLVDLPGYGYAKASLEIRENIRKMIYWYLFDSGVDQRKIVLIIDAKVGPTQDDLEMLQALEEAQKSFVIVANKIDKVKKSELKKQLTQIQNLIGDQKIIQYSVTEKIGIGKLVNEIVS